MRFLIACFAFVLAFGLIAPASAQGFPPGPWRGIWTTDASPGSVYQAELNFTIESSGRVSGAINWMLVSSPQRADQPKIGRRGVGLAVSPNGQYISGLTENNGTWQGRFNLTRFGPQ